MRRELYESRVVTRFVALLLLVSVGVGCGRSTLDLYRDPSQEADAGDLLDGDIEDGGVDADADALDGSELPDADEQPDADELPDSGELPDAGNVDDGGSAPDANDIDAGPPCLPENCNDGSDNDCDGRTDCDDDECVDNRSCRMCDEPEACTDGVDNDCDDRTDCADSDCARSPSCGCVMGEICRDGRDNDCDGDVDCDDSDCSRRPECQICLPFEICTDTIDDDCNGLADCDDPACADEPTCGGECVQEACRNGRDDDCDGVLDCADDDCEGDPLCTVCLPFEICGTSFDEDCNGLIDCADPACAGRPECPSCDRRETDCTDGEDNDCDMLVDCEDTTCSTDPACRPACESQDLESRLGTGVANGTTRGGARNNFTPSCAQSSAPERAFTWQAPRSSRYVFDTVGSSFDTVLYLLRDCDGDELPNACNDDALGLGMQSEVRASVRAGQSVLIVVDGWGFERGNFQLNIREVPTNEAGRCDDGVDNDEDRRTDCDDPDCSNDAACVPMCVDNEVGVASCSDSIDNDCDSTVDCGDSDCAPFGPTAECCNGEDDDNDGFTDVFACRCARNADCNGVGSVPQTCWTSVSVCGPRCDLLGGDQLCSLISPLLRCVRNGARRGQCVLR